jgi:Tetratricopeptide repeat
MPNELGNIHRLKSDFGIAAEDFGGALRVYGALGDPAGQASALSNLGLTLRKLGQPIRARDAFEESLRLCHVISIALLHVMLSSASIETAKPRASLGLTSPLKVSTSFTS